jgi:predicted AlkP superfamily pyrophosphatase or phosphodiesterase
MKLSSAVLLSLILFAGPALNALAANHSAKHVLIISIDGLPATALNDPRAPMPTLRKLAAQGAVAEGMRVSNPSVTWPNHTSLVTGNHPIRHGVLFNGLLLRDGPGKPVRVDPRRDKSELVAVPTLYDVAHEAGLSTAEVNWPCTRAAGAIDHGFPDVPEVFQHVTPQLRRELVEAGIMMEDQKGWNWSTTSPASRDLAYTQVAEHIILRHQPRLMLAHLLNVDAAHHAYGAGSPAGYSAIAYADACVRQILEALETAGIRDQTAIFIVSDHGFHRADTIILPNVVLRQHGLLNTAGAQVVSARAQAMTVGGSALVYLTDPETRQEDRRQVIDIFREMEGIDRVLEPGQFAEFGLPDPETNERMADLVLNAKAGFAFSGQSHQEEPVVSSSLPGFSVGHHGYLADDPAMLATFIASGAGIQSGLNLGIVENIDLAPTAAALLGLEMPTADGQVITQILTALE